MQKQFQQFLNNIQEQESTQHLNEVRSERVLLIDALNLFFRNFATINMTNREGIHIGGLAGFIRSLGSLIRLVNPTQIYIIFDGVGASTNRKNLLPEYKSNRGINRITNWDAFEDLDDENESKINQITRLIHYLQCLPVKIGMIDKAEADDIIAYISQKLSTQGIESIIVSSDKDYLQLVSDTITLYRPVTKVFYGPQNVKEEFKVHPANFILYKTLLGDNSDKIDHIKGLGPKTLLKIFPDLKTVPMTLQDIFNCCGDNLGTHKLYAQILFRKEDLKNHYKLMDLKNPILDDRQIRYIETLLEQPTNGFYKKQFLQMYEIDGIGHFIRNIDFWITDTFFELAKTRTTVD